MNLQYLPQAGPADLWSERVGFRLYDRTYVDDVVIVLGRQTADGREVDWFVAVYDHDGNRVPGTSGVTTPSPGRARDVYESFVAQRMS